MSDTEETVCERCEKKMSVNTGLNIKDTDNTTEIADIFGKPEIQICPVCVAKLMVFGQLKEG